MIYNKFYKWISLLLCTTICAGSPAITSMAETAYAESGAENAYPLETTAEISSIEISESENSKSKTSDTGFSESENSESKLSDTESSESENSESKPSDTENSESKSSDTETSESESSNTESSESESPNTESSESESPNTESSESESPNTESSESETSAEVATEKQTIEESTTEESTTEESTIEESITEESITETETSEELTTEETLAFDAQRLIDIETATAAFYELLQEKQLMALLYHTDSYEVQRHAGSYDDTAAAINSGHTLYITGIELFEEQVWYEVSFWSNGTEQTGFVEGSYLAYSDEDWIAWEKEYLADLYQDNMSYGITAYSNATGKADTSDISAFPAIYQDSLRALKSQHPNWTFVPMHTGLDFTTVVSKEMGAKSLIQKTNSNTEKGWVGAPCPTESGWYYATKPAVEHYINPCNFLTENYIFQFEQLTFNSSYHNVSSIQTFLNNTFMKGAIPNDAKSRTYAQAFYDIGKARTLSPIHLASRVYQEQGNGTSALISGTYKGYEGYYNYFNVGVNGSSTEEKIKKGLEYAKSQNWNTRYKSLEGGAATIGNGYILKGQDTIYLEKFNVDANSPYGLYNHQYMQNIQAPASEAISTRRMYAGTESLNSGFVFKIPVFLNMPNERAIQSISMDKSEVVLYRPDTIVDTASGFAAAATLTVDITPADTTDDKTITWTSSKPNIVSVSAGQNTQEAVVTAVAAGEAVITAKSKNNKTATCKVRVEAPIYSLKLTNLNAENGAGDSSATLYAGQSLTLTPDYLPKDTTTETHIDWASDNPSVAEVSNGKVTAHEKGTATITATIKTISASYTIHVDECTVRFMNPDYTQTMETLSVTYGAVIPQKDFPQINNTNENQLFIGWYTGKDGHGIRFDADTPVYDNNLILYPYFEEQGKGFYVVPVGDQVYTGAAIKPEVHVYHSGESNNLIELVQGQDYTVSYKNNKEVNISADKAPTITVKGKGNYSGTDSVSFNILPKPLTDHDITAASLSVAYNGKVQKSALAVYRNGKKLTNKTDYTLTYPYTDSGAYKNAGVYPIVIKGNKNYTGTITVYETISKKIMLSKVSIAKIPNLPYNNKLVDKNSGIGIMPDGLTVTYKNQPLTPSPDGKKGDYTVSFTNNLAVGTATATITAVEGSAYAGSKSITYKIVGTNISKASVNGITPKTYTGKESDVQQDAVSLTLDNNLLKESKDNGVTGDYTVSYANISKAGTATVIFKGINAYTGQLKKTYKITSRDISNGENITMAYSTEDAPDKLIPIKSLSEIHSPYMKGATKPQVRLYFNGTELTAGKDYTVAYANNIAVTTAETPENKLPKLTIKGKGNFKGSLQGTFKITDGAMSDSNGKLSMTASDVTYKNKAGSYKTTITITDANGKKLTAGKDYDKSVIYTYAEDAKVSAADGSLISRKAGETVDKNDIINIDTELRVTVKGIGAYAGNGDAALSATYRVIATDISKAKLKVNAKEYQNGKAVTLEPEEDIKLTLNNVPLVYETDYIILESTYANNTKKGKATVILQGVGKNFGGQRKITFTISSKTLRWWTNNT